MLQFGSFGASLVLTIQLLFIILFGIFVRYGDDAHPGAHDVDTELQAVYSMFTDTHVMIFIGFGFLMTFLRRYSFGGVGFNFLLAAFSVQWAILTSGFCHLVDFTIPIDLEKLLTADIAAAAPLISMGALLGRTTAIQLIFMAIIEMPFYSVNIYLSELLWQATDTGASIFLHAFGAYFGLAASFILHRRKPQDGEHDFGSSYSSDVHAMIGTLFLWIFWPSFNAAEVLEDSKHRAIINTYLSLASCCVTAFILSYLFGRQNKFDMVHVQNSTLAGGVAMGACADLMVQPWAALLVGFLAALVSVFGYTILTPYMREKFEIADTCGVHNLHGVPGIMGGLLSVIMALVATEDLYKDTLYDHYPAMEASNTTTILKFFSASGSGRSALDQAIFQLIAIIATLAMAIVGGLIAGLIINSKLFVLNSDIEKHIDDHFWKIDDEDDNDA